MATSPASMIRPGTAFELDVQRLSELERRHKVTLFAPLDEHQRGDFTIMAAGKGVYLWDPSGKQYLDAVSGIGNVNLGYGQTEIAEAVRDQLETLPYHLGGWHFSTIPSIELAAKLAEIAPKGLTRVFLVSGGSEANETVIKLARIYFKLKGYKNKTSAIALEHGYHGATYGAACLTGIDQMHESFGPFPMRVRHIAAAYRYRCPMCAGESACTLACADQLEKVIIEEGAENVAFFIFEPVLFGGGGIAGPREYYRRIREICGRYEVLMVADEVVTGFGRTGKMFAVEHFGVIPDIMSMAKGISGGYQPLGAVLFKEEIYQTLLSGPAGTTFWHGFTNGGHPAACAAGLKAIEIIQRDGLIENAQRAGRRFWERLEEFRSSPIIGDIRGLGLLACVEFVRNKDTREPFPDAMLVGEYLRKAALKHGLVVRGMGNNVFIAPAIVISPAEVDMFAERLKAALAETENWVAGTNH